MPLQANITILAPALSDTEIWFANAQAWSNYWAGTPATVSISITTAAYVEHVYDETKLASTITIDGTEYALVNMAQFTELRLVIETLNTSYQTLRTELANAGLISQA
jgi:hypothetical protein